MKRENVQTAAPTIHQTLGVLGTASVVLFFNIIVGAPSKIYAVESCGTQGIEIDKERAAIDDLLRKREELNQKFKDYVEADFRDQTEGILDEIHRNSAKKVAFVKKKITHAIEGREEGLRRRGESYCPSCESSSLKNEPEKTAFCRRCPQNAKCIEK